jgi:4-hydroxy-tetrahydrodipicolinate reductase
VVIDFSQPDAVQANAPIVCDARLPLVIGTTGWEKSREHIQQAVEAAGIGCVYASNFSIGVNLFIEIVRAASRLLDDAGYDAYVSEAHHRGKKDFPSGTALRIAEAMLENMKSKSKIETELTQGEAVLNDALLVTSIRAGAIPGTHTVGFESAHDTIELTHRARNRRGFAEGAVKAAEWIATRNGFYKFEDHVNDILSNTK